MCVDVILHFITFLRGHTHTRKIRTRPEKQFRGPWTLAAEDTWMLKVVLINADCSAVMRDINFFTKLSNIRMLVQDQDAFIICAYWNRTIIGFFYPLVCICMYYCSTI